MKTSEPISFWPISPQSSQERLKKKDATTSLCATWCLLSGPDIVSNIAIRLRTLSETRNSNRHVVITANHVPSDSSAKSGENCYIDTPVFAMPRKQLGPASTQTSLNKSNLYKRYQTTALHVWTRSVGQLSEVKNWATSGAQLGIVVLQVCITPTKSYQIKEHYPELVASAREFHIRDQPKFLTDTLKILPGILLLLPQVSRAHCMRKHQTNPIQRNLSRRWKRQSQSVSDLFSSILIGTIGEQSCHNLSLCNVMPAQRSRHRVKHRHQVKNPKRNEEFQ